LTSDLRYKHFDINPDEEYLKILVESNQDVAEIYQNTIDIKETTESNALGIEEILGLVFKNSLRTNRTYQLIEGEYKLKSETVKTFSSSDFTHNTDPLHEYSVVYEYSGGQITSMTIRES
jgi:hypothetical protein